MSDLEELDLIKSFLALRDGKPGDEIAMAWENFYHIRESLIGNLIKNCADRPEDVDDIFQEVWLVLIEKPPKLRYDPKRGSLRAWVIVVARCAALRAGAPPETLPGGRIDSRAGRGPHRSGARSDDGARAGAGAPVGTIDPCDAQRETSRVESPASWCSTGSNAGPCRKSPPP